MTIPSPAVSVQGSGAVASNLLNTYVQAVASLAQLRGFVGIEQMLVYLEGAAVAGDGGQGFYVWNAKAPGPDDGAGVIMPVGLAVGAWVKLTGTAPLPPPTLTRAIEYVIDGGGSVIPTGLRGALYLPFECTLEAVTLLADQAGSVQVDVYVDPLASYPPVDSIFPTDYRSLSGTAFGQDLAAGTNWTTLFPANSVIGFYINSASNSSNSAWTGPSDFAPSIGPTQGASCTVLEGGGVHMGGSASGAPTGTGLLWMDNAHTVPTAAYLDAFYLVGGLGGNNGPAGPGAVTLAAGQHLSLAMRIGDGNGGAPNSAFLAYIYSINVDTGAGVINVPVTALKVIDPDGSPQGTIRNVSYSGGTHTLDLLSSESRPVMLADITTTPTAVGTTQGYIF